MASRDQAFQWESEVLRASGRRRTARSGPLQSAAPDSGDWLTVREASEATGIPTSTIRKWARHDNIPSFLEETSNGYLRLVSMDGIARWSDEIGREIDPPAPGPSAEVDLTAVEENTEDPEPTQTPEEKAPEGSMIVPLDAWNRMLNQLGNLHEAGQQLAEARERAAKAETESLFLKERLADLREELEKTRTEAADVSEARGADEAEEASPETQSPVRLARKVYEGWRSKRRARQR